MTPEFKDVDHEKLSHLRFSTRFLLLVNPLHLLVLGFVSDLVIGFESILILGFESDLVIG